MGLSSVFVELVSAPCVGLGSEWVETISVLELGFAFGNVFNLTSSWLASAAAILVRTLHRRSSDFGTLSELSFTRAAEVSPVGWDFDPRRCSQKSNQATAALLHG